MYNLDSLKEIKVTDSYMGLDQNIRSCQNNEPLENCTTRYYIDTLLEDCGCLPLNIILSENVTNIFFLPEYSIITELTYLCRPLSEYLLFSQFEQ